MNSWDSDISYIEENFNCKFVSKTHFRPRTFLKFLPIRILIMLPDMFFEPVREEDVLPDGFYRTELRFEWNHD